MYDLQDTLAPATAPDSAGPSGPSDSRARARALRAGLGADCLRLAAILALLLLADWAYGRAHTDIPLAGPLDESAHLFFAALALLALGRPLGARLGRAALVASVAIDVDHIPAELGARWLTAGTPRPYTHSLLMLALVTVTALAWRRRRAEAVGVLIGLVAHFWRDLGESGSGVALLWPGSAYGDSVPHVAFLASVAALTLACVARIAQTAWSNAARSGAGLGTGRSLV